MNDVAILESWTRGRLKYKLHKHQKPLYEQVWTAINNPRLVKYAVNAARRFGKSTVLSLIAIEFAIRFPRSIIRFAAPTTSDLQKIVKYNVMLITDDCPKEHKPEWRSDVLTFPNGSEIHSSGCNNGHYVNLRGHTSHLCVVDEAGFVDELENAVDSVLLPQTLTTGGRTILSSTPPEVVDHPFTQMFHQLEEEGNTCTFTLDDNTSISEETKMQWIHASGGLYSTKVQREYFCKFVSDEKRLIVPEWSEKFIEHYHEDDLYQFYHHYVALDFGIRDFTSALFATYDFKQAKVIVEDEYFERGEKLTTDIVAQSVKDKEKQLWGQSAVYKRVGDSSDLFNLQNLSITHQLHVSAVRKSTLQAMTSELRVWVKQGRLVIDPKCAYLIKCLKFGVWDKSQETLKFGRSTTLGHYDALAALIYLVRSIDTRTNPIPYYYNVNLSNTNVDPRKYQFNQLSANEQAMKKLFSGIGT